MNISTATPRVEIGCRIYGPTSWKRKDLIYRDHKKIGVILLSNSNRQGVTVCIATSERRNGRAIEWCDTQDRLHDTNQCAGTFKKRQQHTTLCHLPNYTSI